MKTFLLCLFAAAVAALVTHYIDRQAFNNKRFVDVEKGYDAIRSDTASLVQARAFITKFVADTQVLVPSAWVFEASDLMPLVTDNNINFLKFYTAVKSGTNQLTLVAVGANKDTADVVKRPNGQSGIYEFASPCPPYCGRTPMTQDLATVSGCISRVYYRKSNR